jgi:lysozyme family protein
MADIKPYLIKLWELEGTKLENVPGDKGSWTKDGIIISEYKEYGVDHNNDGVIDEKDLNLMTDEEAASIVKKRYWDVVKADTINNQIIAEYIVDWGYNCGIGFAARRTQQILGLTVDGNVGPKTIQAINSANQQELFNNLVNSRQQHYKDIVAKNPSQSKFIKGWMARSNYFKFKP